MKTSLPSVTLIRTVFASCLISASLFAAPDQDYVLDGKARQAVVDRVSRLLIDEYIFLETAEKMRDLIQEKLTSGQYDAIDDPSHFASVLREDLYSISRDNHFFMEFNPEEAELLRRRESPSEEEVKKAEAVMLERDRMINFGFEKVERLQGNVGYVDIQLFCNAATGGNVAVAAMQFLAQADAVIVDLRDTPGGYPNMVQLICSYFIRGDTENRAHLNSFERRYNNSIEQYWTLPYLPGKRMYDTDLYVLISRNTGSGAEEFAYNMKNMKRATLVGETTRGSAHPIDTKIVEKHFLLNLPTGRPVNPVSKTNWERVGIEPHVKVSADKALEKAYQLALEKLSLEALDETRRFHVDWALAGLRAKLEPVMLDEGDLAPFLGAYGVRKINCRNGRLICRKGSREFTLNPLSRNLFAFEGLDFVRIEFDVDDGGNVLGMTILYNEGFQEYVSKN